MNPHASASELLAALAGYQQATGHLSYYREQCGNETVITFFVVDSSIFERQMAERVEATG